MQGAMSPPRRQAEGIIISLLPSLPQPNTLELSPHRRLCVSTRVSREHHRPQADQCPPTQRFKRTVMNDSGEERLGQNGAEPLLRVKDVVKTYGTRRALDHVSLTVGAGEFVALLGAN